MMSREQNPPAWSRADVISVLNECSSSGTPALAIPIEIGVSVVTLFVSVSDDEVVLATASESMDTNFCALCPCLVSFSHRGRTMAFLSQIRDWNHGTDPPRLSLDIPTRLLAMEHRQHFRSPLRGDYDLDVRVSTQGGEIWPARPIDISVGGMLIEFRDDPGLPTDAKLELDMRLGEDSVRVTAVVRHRRGCRYGLVFSDAHRDGAVQSNAGLQRLVTSLEGRWLGSERFQNKGS